MNLYIHIPFCKSKCAYCAFLSHCDISKEDEYTERVCREIEGRLSSADKVNISTIYFGGGTPSYIKTENIKKVLETINKGSGITTSTEITLEANPGDLSINKLREWKSLGINRLSLGIQSLDDTVRQKVGRTVPALEVLASISLAQKYFENISVDLIAGLPEEKINTYLGNLKLLADSGVSHISLYDLEISSGSLMHKQPDLFRFSTEDERANFLKGSWAMLSDCGFEQYEISNFAKNKQYCQHNLDFWQGNNYMGFGLGASSRLDNIILENTSDLSGYLAGESATETLLCDDDMANLDIINHFRLNQPLPASIVDQYPRIISDLVLEGFLGKDYLMTEKGKLFNNYVIDRVINSGIG